MPGDDENLTDDASTFASAELEAEEAADVPYAPREFRHINDADLALANRDVLLAYAQSCNSRMEEFFQHFRNMHKRLDVARGVTHRGPGRPRREAIILR